MHPLRIGRIVRTLRRRRGWRQVDLARRALVSQQAISLVETGQAVRLSIRTLQRILAAVEAELELAVRWRGGELDRVLDEGHAQLVAAVAIHLEAAGWQVVPEVTCSIGRDRGSIDLLGLHVETSALLVAEIKTDVTSAEGTLRRHDEKGRLGSEIAFGRFGWRTRSVSRLLVLPDASTARRRIARHDALFRRAYPLRGPDLRVWLRRPTGTVGGLLFMSLTKTVGGRRELSSRRRVRVAHGCSAEHDHAPGRGEAGTHAPASPPNTNPLGR